MQSSKAKNCELIPNSEFAKPLWGPGQGHDHRLPPTGYRFQALPNNCGTIIKWTVLQGLYRISLNFKIKLYLFVLGWGMFTGVAGHTSISYTTGRSSLSPSIVWVSGQTWVIMFSSKHLYPRPSCRPNFLHIFSVLGTMFSI